MSLISDMSWKWFIVRMGENLKSKPIFTFSSMQHRCVRSWRRNIRRVGSWDPEGSIWSEINQRRYIPWRRGLRQCTRQLPCRRVQERCESTVFVCSICALVLNKTIFDDALALVICFNICGCQSCISFFLHFFLHFFLQKEKNILSIWNACGCTLFHSTKSQLLAVIITSFCSCQGNVPSILKLSHFAWTIRQLNN